MPLPPIQHCKTVETRLPSRKAQDSLYESFKEENEHKPIVGEGYAPPTAQRVLFPKEEYSPVTPHTQKKYTAATLQAPHLAQSNKHSPSTPQTPDLAQYLMIKEMVSSGLLAFDDCPENYWAWKASFLATTRELNLSDQEELNLLVKWLGPESSAQAKRIRSVHVNNLEQVFLWYGSVWRKHTEAQR